MANPRENLAALERCFDAFNRKDVERWVETFHPEATFVPMASYLTPPGTAYHGWTGVHTWGQTVLSQWTGIRSERTQAFRKLDDRVLSSFSIVTGDNPVPLTGSAICSFRDGGIFHAEEFATEMDALAAHDEHSRQFRFLFEHASNPIIVNDYDGYLVDANAAACGLYGLSLDKLRGRSIFELTAPERAGRLEELWDDLRTSGQLSGEAEIVSTEGERRPVELRATANFVPGRHIVLFMKRVEAAESELPDRPGAPLLRVAARRMLDERGSAVGGARQPENPGLTARELEVLQLAADGRSTSEIADALYLSSVTVKTHFQHIYKKLGARDRTAAVAECLRRGLID